MVAVARLVKCFPQTLAIIFYICTLTLLEHLNMSVANESDFQYDATLGGGTSLLECEIVDVDARSLAVP